MIFENKNYEEERALYHLSNSEVYHCQFKGKMDGESPLKECEGIKVKDCFVNLRYPFWHNQNLILSDSILKENSRAPLWYCHQVKIENVQCDGIKAIRESSDIQILHSTFNSEEFGWKSSHLFIQDSNFVGPYFLLDTKDVTMVNSTLQGKYSFQYMKNVRVENCTLNTKDAFWHSKDVVVMNSFLKGEYIGWYSDNLTFINCKIQGTQPFCYCKNLKLLNCELIDADFAFENSKVNATLNGKVISIKNPLKGQIYIQGELGEMILQDCIHKTKAKVFVNHKKVN